MNKKLIPDDIASASEELAGRLDNLGKAFGESWNSIALQVNRIAVSKGWYNLGGPNKAERIALLHSELSEALEALRNSVPKSETIPPYSMLEEELADTIIRIMDMSFHYNLDIAGAVLTKIEYNTSRPYRHGGKEL